MKLIWQEILTHIFGFLIILILLRIFAWKPILKLLDERKKRIASELDNIEKAKQEMAKLREEYEVKLKEIDLEARKRIQEAIAEGQKMAAGLQVEAREEAKKVLDRAKENIELEVAKAKVELRDDIVNMAILATEKIINERLDDAKHKELIVEFIEGVEKLK
jgi:F-type H+-transporting ATPase subunit b